MSATRFFVCVIAIIVIACNLFHITFDTTEIVGMVVVVPCLTAALYRMFVVFEIGSK
jgi:hypothetical protein